MTNIKYGRKSSNSELERVRYIVINDFFSTTQCQGILDAIAEFRERHSLTEVYRPFKERSLQYWVINGEEVEQN